MKALMLSVTLHTQWFLMGLDIIDSKLLKPSPLVRKKTPHKNIWKISFDNKIINKINFSRIFRDPLVKVPLPNTSIYFEAPTIIHTLMNLIGSKNFNFNKFINNLNIKAFLDDNHILPSDCTCSPFVDKDHNHNG